MLLHAVYFAFVYCEMARLLLASARRRMVASSVVTGTLHDSMAPSGAEAPPQARGLAMPSRSLEQRYPAPSGSPACRPPMAAGRHRRRKPRDSGHAVPEEGEAASAVSRRAACLRAAAQKRDSRRHRRESAISSPYPCARRPWGLFPG